MKSSDSSRFSYSGEVARAPIFDSFRALEIDRVKTTTVLNKKGIELDGAEAIEDVWVNNNSSPEEVVEALVYEARRRDGPEINE
ncbi:hypothetical protein [Sorangium sp. So ce233]|uniref:hypothetical protein n=1 Tax=Sorangium sp. So ce233 TaxID=3133290 RepID=UPI003F608B30